MDVEQFDLHAEIEQRHWWFLGRRAIMRRLVHRVASPSGQSTVVDIGCGTGGNIAALSNDYRCVGIDPSERGIESARSRFPGVEFICGHAPGDLGETCEMADVLLLMDVIEHVPDDFWLVSQLLSAMKPGAHLVIAVPADESLWSRHDESFGHYRRYDRARLERVWQGLAVTTRLVSHYNARLYPLIKLIRQVNQRRGASSGQAGTDFNIPPRLMNSALCQIFSGEAGKLVGAIDREGNGVTPVA